MYFNNWAFMEARDYLLEEFFLSIVKCQWTFDRNQA